MISPIEEIIEEAKQGKMFVLVDDPNRENEGDLVIPAEFATPEMINFMATYGRGLVCLSITTSHAKILNLNLMSSNNKSRFGTAFTQSIEAAEGVTTGISAYDRAHTIKTAINDNVKPEDVVSPGHIFPIISQEGGVLIRAGHTEASVDIAKIAGHKPAAVICEIMNEDGTMARLPELIKFAKNHQLKIGTISDLIAYRRQSEKLIVIEYENKLENQYGSFKTIIYKNIIDQVEHMAIISGEINTKEPVLVRMHSINFWSDLLGSMHNDKGNILAKSFELISKQSGVIVLINNHMKNSFSCHLTTNYYSNPFVNYGIGVQILKDLKIKNLKLITNNKKKMTALEGFDINIIDHYKI
jgi:3,4-dihydroxy 2-butanone 4-phosphate synthase/GTP cyclohydrolase II